MIKIITKAVLKTIPKGRAVENIAGFVAAHGALIRRFRPEISGFG
jgi:hypothetical protein